MGNGNGGEVLGQSIRMTGQSLHMRELRNEYATVAEELRKELSAEATQCFHKQLQNIFTQARLRTVESALGCEYATVQQNLQQQYFSQAQGLHSELQTAQRQFSDHMTRERAVKSQELETLRRELAEKQQLIREQASDLQENATMQNERHANEEARAHGTFYHSKLRDGKSIVMS